MKKKRFILMLFLFIALFGFIFVFVNLDFIKGFVLEYIGVYGYPAIFVFSLLADLVEQPFGPEIPGLMGIIFGLNFFWVVILTFVGSTIGSLFSYFIGRHGLRESVLSFCDISSHGRYCNLFSKYGKISLLIACWTPVPYVIFCWFAGSFKMKLGDFFIFGVVPRFFRIFLLLGIVRIFI
jgi:membrane protein YqaA with SNARE-associated domain